jgi:hypothetical protein
MNGTNARTSDHNPDLTLTPGLLPTSEAAAYLGVTERHFRRRYAHCLQPVQGERGRLFYARTDLDHVRDRQVRSEDHKVTDPDPDAMTIADREQVRALIAVLQESHQRDLSALLDAHARELATKDVLIGELRRRADEAEAAAQGLAVQLAATRAAMSPTEPLPALRRPWWARLVRA